MGSRQALQNGLRAFQTTASTAGVPWWCPVRPICLSSCTTTNTHPSSHPQLHQPAPTHFPTRRLHTSQPLEGANGGQGQGPRRFNVGVFGAGRIGRLHLPNVLGHRRLRLQWVVEDGQQARDAAVNHLSLDHTAFASVSQTASLLDDPSLDGVLVLTPTETHAGIILQALDKGKSVFVEKPTAQTRQEIEACYDLAAAKDVHLYTGFQRRLDPSMQRLYAAIHAQRAVGDVHNIKTVSRDSPRPDYQFLLNCDPDGCNLLSDMAVHDVDILVWLTKTEVPELIYVVTHSHNTLLREKGVEDSLLVVLKYKSGVIATIDSCRETTFGYDIRLEVFGSDGMATVNNPRETSCVVDGRAGGSSSPLHYSFPERFQAAFQLQLDNFVSCLDGSATPPVTKEEALLTSLIVEKGVQSFREKIPVYF